MVETGRERALVTVVRLAACVAGVVVATLVAFYLVSLATAMVDRGRYASVIEQAVETGALQRRHRLPLGGGEPVSIHNFNDCLILSMLVLPQDRNPAVRALSPMVPADATPWSGVADPGYPPYVQCRDLAAAMSRPTAVPAIAYHRYLHGDWILAKALLAVLPLATAGHAMALALALLLVGLVAAALRSLVSGAGAPRRDWAYLAIALCLLVFGALPVFAWSFSFAPSDIVIAAFLLFFYLRPPSSLSDRGLAVAAALFGTLTTVFEFLTGASPAGLMAMIAVVAFDADAPRETLIRRLAIGTIGFGAAIMVSFALKMAVVALIWGPAELGLFGRQIGAHMSAGGWDVAPENAARLERLGISVDGIRQSALASYLYALSKIVYFSRQMAFGSVALGVVLTVVAPLVLAAASLWRFRQLRDRQDRLRCLLVLAACLVMPAWYLLFTHHTIVHAHFMFRPLVWPLALLLAMQAWMTARTSVPEATRRS